MFRPLDIMFLVSASHRSGIQPKEVPARDTPKPTLILGLTLTDISYLAHPRGSPNPLMKGLLPSRPQLIQDCPGGEDCRPLSVVVCTAKMFRPIMCPIILTGTTVVPKLFLVRSVSRPPMLHICRFRRFWRQIFANKSKGSCIVRLDWRWRLRVSHYDQHSSCWNGLS